MCPRCLLQEVSTATESDVRRGPAKPPALSEIAAAFPDLEVLGFLGAGGMGCVYRVRERESGRVSALKILPREFASDPAFVERFEREARTLARLHHPNIVGIHAFGHRGGFCHLLMEHVDGANLRQTLRSGRFTPAQALALIPPLCDALQYAHSQGVLHRDIKPENILLDAEGRVKIADFGIAKMVGGPESVLDDATLTRTGARLGTPHYMAPEQVEKPEQVDHRADIYSLGVVFYELLTGELPLGRFQVPSAKATLDARVDEIVLRALAKERELRQQSADQVKTEVEGLAGSKVDWMWPFKRMRYWVPVVLIAMALVLFPGVPGVPELVLILGMLTMAFGVWEIRRQRPQLRQYFAAVIGVVNLVLLVAAVVWGVQRLQEKRRRIELVNNLSEIGAVLRQLARNTPEGTIYPASTNLADLGEWTILNQWMVDPVTGGRIEYVGAGSTNPRPQTVLLASPLGPSGRFVYLADGSVQPMTESRYREQLARDSELRAIRFTGVLFGPFLEKKEAEAHLRSGGTLILLPTRKVRQSGIDVGAVFRAASRSDYRTASELLFQMRFLLMSESDLDLIFAIPGLSGGFSDADTYTHLQNGHGGLLAAFIVFASRSGHTEALEWLRSFESVLWKDRDELVLCTRLLDGNSDQDEEEIRMRKEDVLHLISHSPISNPPKMTVILKSKTYPGGTRTNQVDMAWPRIP